VGFPYITITARLLTAPVHFTVTPFHSRYRKQTSSCPDIAERAGILAREVFSVEQEIDGIAQAASA
jgi:hypothetical protein